MPRKQRQAGLAPASTGKPKGTKHRVLPPEVAEWQHFVKYNLQQRGLSQQDLADKLRLSLPGLTHRLSLRAEWHPHDLKDLACMLGVTVDRVLEVYPDHRFTKWEDG